MAAKKKSGHDRKRWRVTFKLPSVKHQHTQRFMDLDTDEYSFTVMGYATGVAVQRAWAKLREVPELKGAIIRDCFITVRCLGYYTKAEEALEKAAGEPIQPIEGDFKSWDDYMRKEGYKEYDNPPAHDPKEPTE